MNIKPTADFCNFDNLDIRVGRIINVEDAETRKPTYRLTVDFGPQIGQKVSCGAYRNYSKDFLVGQQVVGVVNFGSKKMGPEVSEVLILGVPGPMGETIFLRPEQDVELGVGIF